MAEAERKEPAPEAAPSGKGHDNPLADALEERLAATAAPAGDDRAAGPSIMNIEVELRFVLGHARLNVGRLMDLADAQVLEIDRGIGDPIDIVANDTLIAEGELVETENGLGVRVLRICDPARPAERGAGA